MSVIAVTINPGLTIVGVLPAAQPSTAYTYQLTGYGGTPPYTFSTSDTLPGDFELHPDGTFDATTGSALAGAFPFTVTMTDKLGRSTMRSFTLKIIALPLSIAGSLTDAQVGVAWSKNLTISGGIAPYSEPIVIHGPSWMNVSISGTTMTVSGTPTAGYANDHVALGLSDSRPVTTSINVSFAWTTLTLTGTYPDASGGDAYSEDLTIAGGNGSYSLTGGDGVVSGSLPPGLSLSISGSNLTLSGTFPSTGGPWSFTVGVDSGDGQTATSVQSMKVAQTPKLLVVSNNSISNIYKYDIANDSWATAGVLPRTDYDSLNLFRLSDGRIFLTSNSNYHTYVYEYDIDAETFSTKQAKSWNTNNAKGFNASIVLSDDRIFTMCQSRNGFTELGVYNPALDVWEDYQYAASTAGSTLRNSFYLRPDGKVLIVCGDGAGTCQLYDPVAKTLTSSSSLPFGVPDSATRYFVDLPDGSAMLQMFQNPNRFAKYEYATDTWSLITAYALNTSVIRAGVKDYNITMDDGYYNHTTDSWTNVSNSPFGFGYYYAIIDTPDDRQIGFGANNNKVAEFNLSTLSWDILGNAPTSLYKPSVLIV